MNYLFVINNLVTGGAGLIGSHLVDKLIEKGEIVYCLDDLSSGSYNNISHLKNNPNFKFILHDILNPIDLEYKFNKVWHLACPASPYKYLKDIIRTLKINYDGTLNMLEFARKNNAKFLFSSSSEIYGSAPTYPQKENSVIDIKTYSSRSCYAEGKRIAETLCFAYKKNYNLDVKVVRIFNVYGPRLLSNDGRVISNFLFKGLKNKPFIIHGNGEQTRSFCFVEDLVNGLDLIMDSKIEKPINLGSTEEISIKKLAILISKMLNLETELIYQLDLHDNINRRKPNIDLAKDILNWQPETNLIEGLEKTISFFMKKVN